MDLLVTGAGGQLGSVVMAQLAATGLSSLGTVRPGGTRPAGTVVELDLLQRGAVVRLLATYRPRRVLHLAALAQPPTAETDPARAQAVNVELTKRLADACAQHGSRLLLASTDMVFDGEQAPYGEDDAPHPTTVYGTTKAAAEAAVLACPGGLVARLPLLYGVAATARRTALSALVAALRAAEPVTAFADEYRTPASFDDGAAALIQLLQHTAVGVVHLGGPDRLSRADMVRLTAQALGVAPQLTENRRADYRGPDRRPRDLSLRSERFHTLFGRPPARPMRQTLPELLARC